MHINHIRGRSIADTGAMAALTRRSPWAVRTLCHRDPDGYDVDACTLKLQDHPDEPLLLTASQAEQHFIPRGIRVSAGTVRQWAFRGQLKSYQRDDHNRPLYNAADILALAKDHPVE